MVENLPLYDEWMEVTNLLVWRDAIQDALAAGDALTTAELGTLEQADRKLIELRGFLMSGFPAVFDERGAPRGYWWWHLDEGPQVREQALAEARPG